MRKMSAKELGSYPREAHLVVSGVFKFKTPRQKLLRNQIAVTVSSCRHLLSEKYPRRLKQPTRTIIGDAVAHAVALNQQNDNFVGIVATPGRAHYFAEALSAHFYENEGRHVPIISLVRRRGGHTDKIIGIKSGLARVRRLAEEAAPRVLLLGVSNASRERKLIDAVIEALNGKFTITGVYVLLDENTGVFRNLNFYPYLIRPVYSAHYICDLYKLLRTPPVRQEGDTLPRSCPKTLLYLQDGTPINP